MQQAQQMQADLAAAQEELGQKTFEHSGAGGKIKVTVNGKAELLSLQIDPSIVDPEDAEFLASALLKTIQEASESAKEASASQLKNLTGGLDLPGF